MEKKEILFGSLRNAKSFFLIFLMLLLYIYELACECKAYLKSLRMAQKHNSIESLCCTIVNEMIVQHNSYVRF